MDIIFIKKLSVFTQIGIHNWEKEIKQKLSITIKIGFNKKKLSQKKNKNYIDYDKISKIVIKKIENKKHSLIEDVAQYIAKIILKKFNCYWVKIKVQKPNAILQAKNVGIIIKRKKKSF